MEKTEMMKKYERLIGMNVKWDANPAGYQKWLESEVLLLKEHSENLEFLLNIQNEEISTMKTKATAYDMLMSHGLSMKELANILKHPVAIENEDDQNTLYYFNSTPHIGQFSDGTQFWSCKRKWRLPRQLVNFYGVWEDSLTLPDGWEEK